MARDKAARMDGAEIDTDKQGSRREERGRGGGEKQRREREVEGETRAHEVDTINATGPCTSIPAPSSSL